MRFLRQLCGRKRSPAKSVAAIFIASVLSFSATAIVPAQAANGGVVYTYDALGRITTASYDTGVIVIYSYDANGNRTQQVINVNTANLVWDSGNWDQSLWQ